MRKSKFYNSNYIMFINTIDDLDPSFVNEDPVDYHYDNEFSPIHLINKIDNELSKQK